MERRFKARAKPLLDAFNFKVHIKKYRKTISDFLFVIREKTAICPEENTYFPGFVIAIDREESFLKSSRK